MVEANRAAGRRVAVAESCTGGLVSAALTEIPGSSEMFEAGYVTYSNAAKVQELKVSEEVVETFGAVSVATAWAMARGALAASDADVAVAITGVAGPGGDAVNVASRLEDANKAYGTSIILGDATRREIGDAFLVRYLDRVALRGRTGETDLHELLGRAEVGAPAPVWVRLYEEALALHLAGRHGEAAAGFSGVIATRGGDAASSALLERCRSSRSPS